MINETLNSEISHLDWKVFSLEMDKFGEKIGIYLEDKLDINRIKKEKCLRILKEIGNFKRARDIDEGDLLHYFSKESIGEEKFKALAVYGTGNLHHYTLGLCKHASRLGKEFCYIHIDNHSDAFNFGIKNLTGGAFVPNIPIFTLCRQLFYIRNSGNSEYDYQDLYIDKKDITKYKDELYKLLNDIMPHVYISIDLDVMAEGEILTDWNRGRLDKETLLEILSIIKENKEIISADVLGFHYNDITKTEQLKMIKKSKELYKDIIQRIID